MHSRLLTLIGSAFIGICLQAQANIDFMPKKLSDELMHNFPKGYNISDIELEQSETKKIRCGKYFELHSKQTITNYNFVYVGRVNTCRAGGCEANQMNTQGGKSEYFDYYILFDSCGTVMKIKIYNYQATHGQEVASRGWLKQFEGYKGTEELEPGKNVDAISGATISVDAISFDIELKTSILKHILFQRKIKNSGKVIFENLIL